MELRLPLEMSPGREAACRAVFGTWPPTEENQSPLVQTKRNEQKNGKIFLITEYQPTNIEGAILFQGIILLFF